jgi:PAS domain S-box-containing protein
MSAEWQFLVTLNERLRRLRDPVEIQQAAVRLLGEHLQVNRVHYAEIDGDRFNLTASYVSGVSHFPQRGPTSLFGKAIDAFRRGEAVVVGDVSTDMQVSPDGRALLRGKEIGAFVGIPLIKEGRWLAVFSVHSATARAWTREQIALVEMTADRAWSAADRGRTEAVLGRSEDRQAFLRRLNDAIRPMADPDCILAETCRLLGTYLRVNRVAYGRVSGADCIIETEYLEGLPSMVGTFPWARLAGGRVGEIMQGGSLVTNDTWNDPRTADQREALKAAGIGAYLCPLLIKDGQWVGAFGIHSREPRVWNVDEIALAQEVADRIWATLEHRRVEAELRANEERLSFLLRLNDAIRPMSDPGEVQETAARMLGEYLGVSRVGYAEIDGRNYIIRREYTKGVASLIGQKPMISTGPILREAFRRGETVAVTDVDTDPRIPDEEKQTLRARQIAAFIGATLFKGGKMVAAFGANNTTPRVWAQSEIEIVHAVAERTWDAVERTRAEGELRERKTRFRLALEASAGGSWTWDAATNTADWDERFRELYGFPAEAPADAQAWLPLVHEDDRAQVYGLLDEIYKSRTKDSWVSTFRIVRPDGTLVWVQSRGRADRDADGNLTRLTGLDLDYSEQRRTEEARQALRDEEHDRALRLLLETAAQGIVSVDAGGKILSANEAIENMFGWKRGELLGQPLERLLPSALRHAHAEHRGHYFAAPHPRLMGGGLHLAGERKDGSTFPIEVSLNHVTTDSGGRAFAFVTDITERQRAAAALRERTAELEYRTMQLSRMASDLTLAEQNAREQIAKTLHDGLQQLLVIVSLNLQQQVKRDSEGGHTPSEALEQAKHHLDEAIAAARSLNFELFPPVLQHSGLPVALTWLAHWTQTKYGLKVTVSADPHADSARKDVRTLIFESVRELLFNAVKHAKADRVALDVTLDADERLCITVSDKGIGFDPASLNDRTKDGEVGWGLFSIRERVTLLGGRLDIESAPGKGTRFRLVAPRGSAQADVVVRPVSLAPITPVAADGERALAHALRILIVDDHVAVRKALREILHERPELRVVGDASNGFEAIAHAHTLHPDVILMDVSMPHMDGIEATRRIHAELPSIQVVGLSMQARPMEVQAIEHAGAADFFVKGIDTDRLIAHLLGVHAARLARTRVE